MDRSEALVQMVNANRLIKYPTGHRAVARPVGITRFFRRPSQRFREMSLSTEPTGAALGDGAFSSQQILDHTLEEELLHFNQNLPNQRSGPGTASDMEAESMPQEKSQNRNDNERRAEVHLLHEASVGHLENLECPKCRRTAVSVRFSHPVADVYRTWFICADCNFHARVQNTERPRFFSDDRVSAELEERDLEIIRQAIFRRPPQ
jgi:hypothetical protein